MIVYGTRPSPFARKVLVTLEAFVKPKVFKQESDKNRITELVENELPPVLDYMEAQIPKVADARTEHPEVRTRHIGSLDANDTAIAFTSDDPEREFLERWRASL